MNMTIQSHEFSAADAAWLTEGYQTMINATLRGSVGRGRSAEERPLTVEVLRKVLREELHT